MSEKLRLTLTSQALDRLLGGDTEIEIELRQGIAKEFAKKHLEHVISEAVAKRINEMRVGYEVQIKNEVNTTLATLGLGGGKWNAGGAFMSQMPVGITNAINKSVKDQVASLVDQQVQSALKSLDLTPLIEAALDAAIRRKAFDKFREEFNDLNKLRQDYERLVKDTIGKL